MKPPAEVIMTAVQEQEIPRPMDLAWAKDGVAGELLIVQARPETVHSAKPRTAAAEMYRLTAPPERRW